MGAIVASRSRHVRVRPTRHGKKRVALVIGNWADANSQLRNPVNDAQAITSTHEWDSVRANSLEARLAADHEPA